MPAFNTPIENCESIKTLLDSAQAELRAIKRSQTVKDDALQEMRAENTGMRNLMQRMFGLLEQRKFKIPSDLSQAYRGLISTDNHDWQQHKGTKVSATKPVANPFVGLKRKNAYEMGAEQKKVKLNVEEPASSDTGSGKGNGAKAATEKEDSDLEEGEIREDEVM